MKLLKYIMTLSVAISLFGCQKDEVKITDTHIGESRLVFFPTIEVKGDQLMILQQGATFTDPGVTALLNGQPNQVTTTGTVNTATPGVYSLNYETKNAEGFSAATFRTVAVIGSDISAATDFSGTYERIVSGAPNGQTSTWTKTAKGVYTVVNPGGATGVTATAVNYTGNRIVIPAQMTAAGVFSSALSATSGHYYPNATPPYYEWAIVNPGYGTALRTFKKK